MELTVTTLAVIAIIAALGITIAVDFTVNAEGISPIGECARALKNASASLCHRIF